MSETRSDLATEREAILDWLVENDFAGYDPYDGLESRVFQCLPLSKSKLSRLAWCQLLKRVPLNLRPLLRVPRQRNAKGLALVLAGLARLPQTCHHERIAAQILEWLRAQMDPRAKGWGYPFAWQNRAFYAPSYTPNAVCSAFVVHALLDYGEASDCSSATELAATAIPFFLHDLNRTTSPLGVSFSYTSRDRSTIHNVNLLVASALGRLGRLTTSLELEELAVQATRHTLAHQHPDGAWFYGEAPAQQWIDSLHTGFNLVALHTLERMFPSIGVAAARRRGFGYFQATLLDDSGLPKYYDRSRYPIDAHACAQAILTLLDARDLLPDAIEKAIRIAYWTKRVLGRPGGRYAYQRGRFLRRPIVYTRWSQAWMFRSLAELDYALAIQ